MTLDELFQDHYEPPIGFVGKDCRLCSATLYDISRDRLQEHAAKHVGRELSVTDNGYRLAVR